MATTRALRVSAPGKVLVTGGYLVLDERFAGVVLSTSARFHAQVAAVAGDAANQSASDGGEQRIVLLTIESPQYEQRIAGWVVQRGDALAYELLDGSDRNAYVEETVLCTINGIAGLEALGMGNTFQQVKEFGESVKITLQADNDFYSQVHRLQQAGKDLTRSHLQELPRFLPPITSRGNDGEHCVAKTGMGSSAALVTSLVAAMMSFFVPTIAFQEREEHLHLVHHLAQLAHCYIQRKIGSGFDIAAACFGSQRYTRFPASILADFTSPSSLLPADIAQCITDHDSWDVQRRTKRFQIPLGLHLMMGDVSSGSATVSMVRKVLAWQKSHPDEANKLVATLNQRNTEVEQSLNHVGTLLTGANGKEDPEKLLKLGEMGALASDKWADVDQPLASALTRVRVAYSHVRELLREMGYLAGVPIEPKEQTAILDATMALPGVLMAGVPGAGGYDAIFVIALHQQALCGVEKLWLAWPETHPDSIICPLLCDVEPDSSRAGVLMEPTLL